MNQTFHTTILGPAANLAIGGAAVAQSVAVTAGDTAGLLSVVEGLGIDAPACAEPRAAVQADASTEGRNSGSLGARVTGWLARLAESCAPEVVGQLTAALLKYAGIG